MRRRSLRARVEARAEGRCEYCQAPQIACGYRFHLDHIVPVVAGGSDEEANLGFFAHRTGKGIVGHFPVRWASRKTGVFRQFTRDCHREKGGSGSYRIEITKNTHGNS